ncbi:MAG: NUDIX hydrolase [Hyphomicrobiales bacterium]|nr:NUDIX hydrolase [Hyphomicrobiales bacterium]MCP5000695.1 NUDIX hydrolase [Hyphomicrobiales bacterium]
MLYPRIAVSSILKRQDRYLMVLRGSGRSMGDHAFPGGKVEAGEHLAEAALRELREETGIVGHSARFFRLYDLIARSADGPVESHYVLAVHLVEADGDQQAIAADDATEAGWYTAAEIRSLQTPPSVMECIDYIEAHGLQSVMTVPAMES